MHRTHFDPPRTRLGRQASTVGALRSPRARAPPVQSVPPIQDGSSWAPGTVAQSEAQATHCGVLHSLQREAPAIHRAFLPDQNRSSNPFGRPVGSLHGCFHSSYAQSPIAPPTPTNRSDWRRETPRTTQMSQARAARTATRMLCDEPFRSSLRDTNSAPTGQQAIPKVPKDARQDRHDIVVHVKQS